MHAGHLPFPANATHETVESQIAAAESALRYGGGVAYWDTRHAEDATSERKFDWLFEYAHLRNLLSKHIAHDDAVLQLGCGNSRLAQEWWEFSFIEFK